MFAVAVAAGDANRTSVAVGHDDRMHAIELAGAADVLDRVPGAVAAIGHGSGDSTHFRRGGSTAAARSSWARPCAIVSRRAAGGGAPACAARAARRFSAGR